ncbi:MAG TPA: hypothetical protein DEP05_00125 [Betaproteobacteria bacterium]|nr:hypothetical protein [Betaproteobacteria bacterium]
MRNLGRVIVACLFLSASIVLAGNNQNSKRSLAQIVYEDCMPVHFVRFKEEKKENPEVLAHFYCKIISGLCSKDPGGARCRKGIGGYDLKRHDSGPSQLYRASEAGNAQLVEKRIGMGYSPNAPLGGPGWTPLMIAAAEGHEETVQILLEAGAAPNARNNLGRTALMFASNDGFAHIVSMLLVKGANPNILPKNDDGWGALMAAAKKGRPQVVRILLDHGADASLKDKRGRTASDLANTEGYPGVVHILKQYQ